MTPSAHAVHTSSWHHAGARLHHNGSHTGRLECGVFWFLHITKVGGDSVKKVMEDASRQNLCIVHYLSTKPGMCNISKHTPGCAAHKFSKAVQELRPKFEHKPFRTDAKAKSESA